ncbi:MAG: DNA/RNA non-specific endonuclease [Bacteroidales bacterium]|nr:DNA/RNA non-specific endonuclease [Bacteroidales bacterium]
MKKTLALFLLVLLSWSLAIGQEEATTSKGIKVLLWENGTWTYADSTATTDHVAVIPGLEIPRTTAKDAIIKHTGYTLSYNEEYEQANWVAYELTKEETKKAVERSNKFKPDPLVKTGSARDEDYLSSGYDRGHLAPAADMSWSAKTMTESFFYSNMSPQEQTFNRGIWKKLEEQVREWAIQNGEIYVVTGPVLVPGLKTIGPNKVGVPKAYYKVILDYSLPDVKAIAFVMPNEASDKSLQSFVVSIDNVEKITGLDFFPLLPDKQENTIEKTVCLKCWEW